MELKRLDDMEFLEVKNKYSSFFLEIIKDDIFNNISDNYENKYSHLLNLLEKKFKFASTMGRADLQYGRNMLYGWYLEELFLEVLKKNKFISKVKLFGDDKEHNFIIEKDKIKPKGKKSTSPDFLIELKNSKKIFIELKSAAKNIFSIKKGNVETLKKSIAEFDIVTSIIMVDINFGLYELQGIDYFKDKRPFVNNRMEGQLCYDFPTPKNSFIDFVNEDLQILSLINFNEDISIKKLKLLEKAKKLGKAQIKKIIINKIRIEKLEEDLGFYNENILEKIKLIEEKNPDVKKSWEEIEEILEK